MHSAEPVQAELSVAESTGVGSGIVRIAVRAAPGTALPRAGQFYAFRCGDTTSPLLRRPLSIHRVREEEAGLRLEFLVRIVGPGTAWLASRCEGDSLDVIGPLGNGFDPLESETAVLVARGIGIAPLFGLGEDLRSRLSRDRLHVIMGARYAGRIFLREELSALGRLHLYTDDGSEGFRGRAPDLLGHLIETGVLGEDLAVYACGPERLLMELAQLAGMHGFRGQAALEAHMGCGIGACLSCAVPLRPGAVRTGPLWPKPALQRSEDGSSAYSLICRDGPVYDLLEVDWDAWCT